MSMWLLNPSMWITTTSEYTRWFKYDRDWSVYKQAESVPVIFEPPCVLIKSCHPNRLINSEQDFIGLNTANRPCYTMSHQAEYCQQTTLHSVTSSWILSADHATQCHIKLNTTELHFTGTALRMPNLTECSITAHSKFAVCIQILSPCNYMSGEELCSHCNYLHETWSSDSDVSWGSVLLECDTVSLGNCLLIFWRNVFSRVRQSKTNSHTPPLDLPGLF
jgi:hypothetical protein